jgi:protein phosphatase
METLARICSFDSQLLLATPYRMVDVTDPAQVAEASAWWTDLAERGMKQGLSPSS